MSAGVAPRTAEQLPFASWGSQLDLPRVTRDGRVPGRLHTREVAGSKPAAPIGDTSRNWAVLGSRSGSRQAPQEPTWKHFGSPRNLTGRGRNRERSAPLTNTAGASTGPAPAAWQLEGQNVAARAARSTPAAAGRVAAGAGRQEPRGHRARHRASSSWSRLSFGLACVPTRGMRDPDKTSALEQFAKARQHGRPLSKRTGSAARRGLQHLTGGTGARVQAGLEAEACRATDQAGYQWAAASREREQPAMGTAARIRPPWADRSMARVRCRGQRVRAYGRDNAAGERRGGV